MKSGIPCLPKKIQITIKARQAQKIKKVFLKNVLTDCTITKKKKSSDDCNTHQSLRITFFFFLTRIQCKHLFLHGGFLTSPLPPKPQTRFSSFSMVPKHTEFTSIPEKKSHCTMISLPIFLLPKEKL